MPTVVIADDSPLLRRIVTSVLTSGAFDVVAAEDGVSAVAAVYRSAGRGRARRRAAPCLRTGGDPPAQGRLADRTIPIVLASQHDAAGGRFWAAHAGADRCLTRDFEPAELTATVRELIEAARAGQDPRRTSTTRSMRPRPVELADEEVLARACELLDRHLFETSVAAEVTALGTTSGFELTIAGLLRLLARFVDHDLAAVLLPGTRTAYVSVANVATRDHYGEFVTAAAGTLTSSGGAQLTAADLDARVADPRGLLLADSEDFPDGAERSRMTTYLSMPLRDAGGSVVAVLALSSASTDAFGGTELATLRVIEGPAAAVIDHARACGQPPSQTLRSCWSWTFVTSHATRPAAPVKPA